MVFEPSCKNWCIRLHNVCANKKISRLCVIFLKKYLEISTENYTFANVILNTIFYLKKTNTYW